MDSLDQKLIDFISLKKFLSNEDTEQIKIRYGKNTRLWRDKIYLKGLQECRPLTNEQTAFIEKQIKGIQKRIENAERIYG